MHCRLGINHRRQLFEVPGHPFGRIFGLVAALRDNDRNRLADMSHLGRPMSEVELAVLDRFEEVTKRQELMLEFRLQPGEMYFIKNYTILHARTAFDDFEEEDRRRHLLRLWLEVPQMRPVNPHIRSGGIDAVPGRTPSYDWSKLTNDRN